MKIKFSKREQDILKAFIEGSRDKALGHVDLKLLRNHCAKEYSDESIQQVMRNALLKLALLGARAGRSSKLGRSSEATYKFESYHSLVKAEELLEQHK